MFTSIYSINYSWLLDYMFQPRLSVSSVWLHDTLSVDSNKVQLSGVDVGQQSFLLLSTFSSLRKLQCLAKRTVPWGTYMRDVTVTSFCICAESFSSQSHQRASPYPSQEPHLEATCAQDLGGSEPGPKTALGDILCKAGIAGLSWLLVNHF